MRDIDSYKLRLIYISRNPKLEQLMKTVGQQLDSFRVVGVKPGFNHHEENGISAFEDINERSFAGK